MKKYYSIISIFSFILCIGCQDYSADIPDACIIISRISGYSDNGQAIYEETSTFEVGEDVIVSSCSDADKFSVYIGQEGFVYGEEGATGTSLSSDPDAIVTTSYSEPGTYTITLIATNYSTGSTDVELERSTVSKDITIVE